MGFKGNLQSYSLGDLFQNISSNNRTGMLKLFGPQGEKYIYFAEGQIRLLAHGKAHKGMLKEMLRNSKLIAPEQLEKADQEAAENNTSFSNVILDKGYIEEENLKALIHFAIEEDIYDLFTWNEATFEFIDGPPDNEIFDGELFAEENAFKTDHLVMEAARRSDEWGRIREVITSDENVFVTVNEARNKLENFEQGSVPLQIIMHVDGYRSVGEIVNSAGVGKFDVYEGLFHLYQQGIVRHKTFEELFQTGVELKGKQQIKKAIVFLKRALDVQDNIECRRNLAELYEMDAESKSASEEYMAIGRGYVKNGDEESALEAFRKVIELDPETAEPHNEIAEILSSREMMDEAVEEYIHYAYKLLETKNIQKSREICYRILNIKHQNYEAHRLLAKGYLWEGNSESAIAEYRSLAQALLANMKPKQAIKTYGEILESDCNFPAVKEGVKDFLLKSGEVKSYGLMRFILTLIILIILGGAGLAAYFIYQKTAHRQDGQEEVQKLITNYKDWWAQMRHKHILNKTRNILKEYYMFDDIKKTAEDIQLDTQNDLKEKLQKKYETAEESAQKGEYGKSSKILDTLISTYSREDFPFIGDQIEQWQTTKNRIHVNIVGKEIEEYYKQAVKEFEKGMWAQALKTDVKGLSAYNGLNIKNIEKLEGYVAEKNLLAGRPGLESIQKDIGIFKDSILNADTEKDVQDKLTNCIDLYKEIVECYFSGKKLFERYELLKDAGIAGYDSDVLKDILERSEKLGSEKAARILKKFDNQQAQKMCAEASKLEHEGRFQESLMLLRKVLKKYRHTKTAGNTQYFFVVRTEPEGMLIDINGKNRGKTDIEKVYRYQPGERVTVTLHYPTFKTQQFTVNESEAVYPITMKRGYEKKFQCRGDINCQLLLSGNNLYFGDSDGYMYSLTCETFTNNWDGIERPFKIGITGTPFLYRGVYYFGTARGDVAAFSGNGSNKPWPYRGDSVKKSKVIGFAACENPIKMNEFLLFCATKKGDIFALDADTGRLKWHISSIPGIESGLFVKDTELYTGGSDGVIYGIDIFNPRNVKSVFQISVRKSISTDFTVVSDAAVFFGAQDRRVYSIDISRGLARDAIKNSDFQTNDWIHADIHIKGGRAYCGSYDHHLYCLSLSSDYKMKKEWSFETEDRIEAEPALVDDMVYFGDAGGTLYAVNTGNIGKNTLKVTPEWKYSTGGRITSGLIVWRNYLIVPTEEGIIYAFKVK